MPFLGAHMSIAGGYFRAVVAARRYGCQAVQLFTKNTSQWRAKELTAEDLRLFRQARRGSGVRFAMAHSSYLVNLASPDEVLFRRSIESFHEEMRRAEALGLAYLVVHPGSPLDSGEAAGIARVAAALDELHGRAPGFRVRILLENTAGQGNTLGHRFEHFASIFAKVRESNRLGVCLDTCHLFAAGYGLASATEYRLTMAALSRAVGVRRVRAFHLNDSLKPFGSRVDRHAHIGQGEIGLEAFRRILNDARFRNLPMVLETPKEDAEGKDLDAMNFSTLRSLLEQPPQALQAGPSA